MALNDTRSVTYDELANALGITLSSAKNLARRKPWSRTIGNDKRARVAVPLDVFPDEPEALDEAPVEASPAAPIEPSTVALRETIAGLTAELEGERDRRREAADRHDRETAELRAALDRWATMAERLSDQLDKMREAEQRGLFVRLFGRHQA